MILVLFLPQARLVREADDDMGHEIANDSIGGTMEPVSWQEMRCPKTGKVEKRKCAKPEGL